MLRSTAYETLDQGWLL